ncbi:MAG: beta strand repeat-containing protein [Pseudomonadota bacterium]
MYRFAAVLARGSALGLALLLLPVSGSLAQATAEEDQALADFIESVTRRDIEGVAKRALPNGLVELQTDGRFQQVALARLQADGEAMLGCVGTLDEAQRFLGRDLRTGKALPAALRVPDDNDLAARAARYGISPMQLRVYESMIEQILPADVPKSAKAATINIVNNDGAGEGFNDPSPRAAVAGNTGTTLGQQRLNVFNRAAAIWGAYLDSPVPITVGSRFDPLPCSPTAATLGAAGSVGTFSLSGGFAGTGTLFGAALTNKLIGSDANPTSPEVSATFNALLDGGSCLGGRTFYYGLDNATPAGTTNLLVVVLHELGHGLGSQSFTAQDGSFAGGIPDIWARFQFDRSLGLSWAEMTPAQRATSATTPGNLLWVGPNVRIASSFLTAARDPVGGGVELFTPNPYQGGSSVSHWNITASPNLLMEPFINVGLSLDLDLTRQQMRDIGWFPDSDGNGTADSITGVQPSGGILTFGSPATITWTNNGGFSRNVTIELSTDGGGTFPTVIASNVPNTGSRVWTVPSTATTQARIRVREHAFASPAGVSSANITITANTAPTFTPAAAITRQQGSAGGAAVTVGTVTDAQTAAGSLTVTSITGGTAVGVTATGITNTAGTVAASVAASCTATAGTLRFQVSDGSLTGTGNLQVNITANAPPVLTYTARNAPAGTSLTVNPTALSDNGSVASVSLVSQGTYTGTLSVNAATGAVTLTGLAPAGTHTITLRATDNCGATTNASFALTVNTPPTFTPAAAITRQRGSAGGAAVTVGTVADAQTAAGSLSVTSFTGGTAVGGTAAGITNPPGTVAASVAASCTATAGTLRFQVSDGSLTGTGNLQVNVTANTAPALVYGARTGTAGTSLTVNPTTRSDNGSVTNVALFNRGTYTGGITVNASTGVLTLSALAPRGVHTIVLRATDNCGATTNANFQLTVN